MCRSWRTRTDLVRFPTQAASVRPSAVVGLVANPPVLLPVYAIPRKWMVRGVLLYQVQLKPAAAASSFDLDQLKRAELMAAFSHGRFPREPAPS